MNFHIIKNKFILNFTTSVDGTCYVYVKIILFFS